MATANSIVEEQAAQVLHTFEGMETRLVKVLEELPADRKDYWLEKFQGELSGIGRIVGMPTTAAP